MADADDAASPWACGQCGFENAAEDGNCAVCSCAVGEAMGLAAPAAAVELATPQQGQHAVPATANLGATVQDVAGAWRDAEALQRARAAACALLVRVDKRIRAFAESDNNGGGATAFGPEPEAPWLEMARLRSDLPWPSSSSSALGTAAVAADGAMRGARDAIVARVLAAADARGEGHGAREDALRAALAACTDDENKDDDALRRRLGEGCLAGAAAAPTTHYGACAPHEAVAAAHAVAGVFAPFLGPCDGAGDAGSSGYLFAATEPVANVFVFVLEELGLEPSEHAVRAAVAALQRYAAIAATGSSAATALAGADDVTTTAGALAAPGLFSLLRGKDRELRMWPEGFAERLEQVIARDVAPPVALPLALAADVALADVSRGVVRLAAAHAALVAAERATEAALAEAARGDVAYGADVIRVLEHGSTRPLPPGAAAWAGASVSARQASAFGLADGTALLRLEAALKRRLVASVAPHAHHALAALQAVAPPPALLASAAAALPAAEAPLATSQAAATAIVRAAVCATAPPAPVELFAPAGASAVSLDGASGRALAWLAAAAVHAVAARRLGADASRGAILADLRALLLRRHGAASAGEATAAVATVAALLSDDGVARREGPASLARALLSGDEDPAAAASVAEWRSDCFEAHVAALGGDKAALPSAVAAAVVLFLLPVSAEAPEAALAPPASAWARGHPVAAALAFVGPRRVALSRTEAERLAVALAEHPSAAAAAGDEDTECMRAAALLDARDAALTLNAMLLQGAAQQHAPGAAFARALARSEPPEWRDTEQAVVAAGGRGAAVAFASEDGVSVTLEDGRRVRTADASTLAARGWISLFADGDDGAVHPLKIAWLRHYGAHDARWMPMVAPLPPTDPAVAHIRKLLAAKPPALVPVAVPCGGATAGGSLAAQLRTPSASSAAAARSTQFTARERAALREIATEAHRSDKDAKRYGRRFLVVMARERERRLRRQAKARARRIAEPAEGNGDGDGSSSGPDAQYLEESDSSTDEETAARVKAALALADVSDGSGDEDQDDAGTGFPTDEAEDGNWDDDAAAMIAALAPKTQAGHFIAGRTAHGPAFLSFSALSAHHSLLRVPAPLRDAKAQRRVHAAARVTLEDVRRGTVPSEALPKAPVLVLRSVARVVHRRLWAAYTHCRAQVQASAPTGAVAERLLWFDPREDLGAILAHGFRREVFRHSRPHPCGIGVTFYAAASDAAAASWEFYGARGADRKRTLLLCRVVCGESARGGVNAYAPLHDAPDTQGALAACASLLLGTNATAWVPHPPDAAHCAALSPLPHDSLVPPADAAWEPRAWNTCGAARAQAPPQSPPLAYPLPEATLLAAPRAIVVCSDFAVYPLYVVEYEQ